MTLGSLQNNQEILERCLTRLGAFYKILSEWKTSTPSQLLRFLNSAKYPTSGLGLLFRAEIATALTDWLSSNCEEVKLLKASMALDRRLPLADLNVVAILLDPSQWSLSSIQNYQIEKVRRQLTYLNQHCISTWNWRQFPGRWLRARPAKQQLCHGTKQNSTQSWTTQLPSRQLNEKFNSSDVWIFLWA